MSGTKFTTTPALGRVSQKLERLRKRLANFKQPYQQAAVFLDQWVQHNFRTEGGKYKGWKPFSPVTLRMISANDPGRMPPKLLQKTGRLRQSFLPFHTRRNAGIGSQLPYSKEHDEGEGRIPQRKILPTDKLVKPDMAKILRGHITMSAKAEGLK